MPLAEQTTRLNYAELLVSMVLGRARLKRGN